MTILKTLQNLIEGFGGMTVLTDFEGKQSGFALQPTGQDAVRSDIIGNKYYTNSYMFFMREIATDEASRADNQDFLEEFFLWLDDQPLPTLPGRFSAEKMTVSNAILLDIESDGTGIYQVQITLEIKKEVA